MCWSWLTFLSYKGTFGFLLNSEDSQDLHCVHVFILNQNFLWIKSVPFINTQDFRHTEDEESMSNSLSIFFFSINIIGLLKILLSYLQTLSPL